jgi:hypothetical protein
MVPRRLSLPVHGVHLQRRGAGLLSGRTGQPNPGAGKKTGFLPGQVGRHALFHSLALSGGLSPVGRLEQDQGPELPDLSRPVAAVVSACADTDGETHYP